MAANDLTLLSQTPWLAPPFEQLQRARSAGRLPSALLIHEDRGSGGELLARCAAQLALCSGHTPPCGVCRDCRRFQASQHPDFYVLRPLEDSKQIRVEQGRELSEQLALTSHGGEATVALITPADAMNPNAANALLKTLEEPRPGVLLILLSASPSSLPATVLSRCQRLRVRAPTRRASEAWLAEQAGAGPWAAVLEVLGEAPFAALALDPGEIARLRAETQHALDQAVSGQLDVATTAERWGRAEGFELRLACVENWLTGRIDRAVGTSGQSPELRTGAHLPGAPSALNIAALLRLLESVYELRRLRLSSINRALALEQLLWLLPRTVLKG
jgi:DNA polymerase III subunit delta'